LLNIDAGCNGLVQDAEAPQVAVSAGTKPTELALRTLFDWLIWLIQLVQSVHFVPFQKFLQPHEPPRGEQCWL